MARTTKKLATLKDEYDKVRKERDRCAVHLVTSLEHEHMQQVETFTAIARGHREVPLPPDPLDRDFPRRYYEGASLALDQVRREIIAEVCGSSHVVLGGLSAADAETGEQFVALVNRFKEAA
jgi:hypothetical protein